MKRKGKGGRLLAAILMGVMTFSSAGMSVAATEGQEISNHVYTAPSNLRWDAEKPGVALVDITDATKGYVYVVLYKDNKQIVSYSGWNEGARTQSYSFNRHITESGSYTFKAKISGSDGSDGRNMSTGAVSQESAAFVYNKPQKALATPQNLRWSSEKPNFAMWDAVDNAETYWVYLYIDGKSSSSRTVGKNVIGVDLSSVMTDTGKNYTFAVRAVSSDINTVAHSDVSGQSPVYSGTSGGGSTGDKNLVWETVNGKSYWYENNIRQGTSSDGKCFSYDGTLRGREIYDPASDGWYWLDVNADGAKAVGKEVFMPYIYQNEADWSNEEINNNANASGANADGNVEHAELADQVRDAIKNGTGKWVRYDNNGKMLKGWVTIEGDLAYLYPNQSGNKYYYDRKTGLMAKGKTVIDGKTYYFDEITGVLKN